MSDDLIESPTASSSSTNYVQFERVDSIAVVTLDRPEKLNAISSAMSRELRSHFATIDEDPGIRVGILAGRGRCFSSGADVVEYAGQDYGEFVARQHANRLLNDSIEANAKPIIAAVHGPALGGGFELALACDLIVAAAGAYFALPEVELGLVPGGGGTQRLTRLIGRSRAKHLAMTAARWSADEAHAAGVVATVVPANDDVLPVTLALARSIASRPPLAAQRIKRLVNDGQDPGPASALSYEQAVLAALFLSEDGQEGIAAFNEKRRPRFGGTQVRPAGRVPG